MIDAMMNDELVRNVNHFVEVGPSREHYPKGKLTPPPHTLGQILGMKT